MPLHPAVQKHQGYKPPLLGEQNLKLPNSLLIYQAVRTPERPLHIFRHLQSKLKKLSYPFLPVLMHIDSVPLLPQVENRTYLSQKPVGPTNLNISYSRPILQNLLLNELLLGYASLIAQAQYQRLPIFPAGCQTSNLVELEFQQ